MLLLLNKVSSFINNNHHKFKCQKYLSDKDRDFYEKIIETKDLLAKRNDQYIKLLQSNLASMNAKIYDLEERLSLRSVVEDFENNSIQEYKEVGKGKSKREKTWDVILRNNYRDILNELGSDSGKDWITVAQDLYKHISNDIHKYRSENVIINRTNMTEEMITLAEAICKSFPISYEIITPPQKKQM